MANPPPLKVGGGQLRVSSRSGLEGGKEADTPPHPPNWGTNPPFDSHPPPKSPAARGEVGVYLLWLRTPPPRGPKMPLKVNWSSVSPFHGGPGGAGGGTADHPPPLPAPQLPVAQAPRVEAEGSEPPPRKAEPPQAHPKSPPLPPGPPRFAPFRVLLLLPPHFGGLGGRVLHSVGRGRG